MGQIQSSLNQLTLSAIGAIGGLAYGFKGGFKKPQAPAEKQPNVEQPKAETTPAMGNVAKIGRDYSRTNFRSYFAAAQAVDSGNDAIAQKARSLNPIENRLKQIDKIKKNKKEVKE